jgi:hypothetical protein
MFDMSRCPQNEEEAKAWFFAGIGQQIGAPATNWEAIMTNCGLPPGYGPGIKPTAAMPYFAFTQQFSGGPKGRIFLPSNQPDELGYYTRCIQYLDDAAQTYSTQAAAAKKQGKKVELPDFTKLASQKSAGGGLVWSWYWVAGNEYSPVQGADGAPGTGTGGGGGVSGLSEQQVQAMIDKSLEGYVKVTDTVAMKMASGLYVSFVGGGPTKDGDAIYLVGKKEVHDWESVKLEKGEREG